MDVDEASPPTPPSSFLSSLLSSISITSPTSQLIYISTLLTHYPGDSRLAEAFISLARNSRAQEFCLSIIEKNKGNETLQQLYQSQSEGDRERLRKDFRERKAELELEVEKGKSNLVKDQIRRAYLSLGDFYLQCLSLPSATKYYARSRDYCSSSNQVLETNIAVMETSLRARDWNQVESSAARAMGVISGQNSPNNLYDKEEGRVHLARGLSYLACGNYSSAFSSFSLIDFDSFSTSVVSHQDVALYTALAGLAVNGGRSSSVDQANATTKGADPRERSKTQFLSSAPQCLRNLLSLFSSGSYGPAITLLTGPGELSDWIRVDPFLSSHTSQTSQGGATNATNPNPSSNTNLAIMSASLITAIKTISLVKYYSPYSSVLLQRLGDEFGMELPEVIASVKDCVEKGLISGRIDLVDGVLREDDGAQKAKAESERQLLDAMDNFAEEGAAMVWRASAMEATGALHSSDPRHKMTKSRGFSSKRTQGRRRNKNQESSLSSRFFREQQGIYTDSDGDDGEDEDDQGFGGERQVAQMEIVE